MPIEQFNPITTLAELQVSKPDWVDGRRDEVGKADIDTLLGLNQHWFKQHFGMKETAALLWLVNQRLTQLGIGPAWRRGPVHADLEARLPTPSRPDGLQMLGTALKKALMRRWIDLDWLRTVLGPGHTHNHRAWQHAFSDNVQFAHTAWARINKVLSRGGGNFGPDSAYMVVSYLKVPEVHRVALTGLIDKNIAKRRSTAQRRVKDDVWPRLEHLLSPSRTASSRSTRLLTKEQAAHRLVVSEAIELGQGRPGDAALIFRWMTGQPITPQSIHTMRVKIAAQCGLKRMYWSRQRAAALQVSPSTP